MSHPTEDDVQADKLVTGLGHALESASARLRAASESASSLDFGKRIQVWLAAQRRLLPILAARGWVLSMRMVPRDIAELLKAYDEQGGDALDQRMVDLCRRDRITGIPNPTGAFAAWGPVLSKAARAHETGDYELAIPIWLLAIEGVVNVALNQPSLFTKVRQKRVQARVAGRLRVDGSVFSEFADSWVDALSAIARPTRKAVPAILNRHSVLHGQVPTIGTEKDSLQGMLCLSLFEFLLGATGRRAAKLSGGD
jgi:hypothetical protein